MEIKLFFINGNSISRTQPLSLRGANWIRGRGEVVGRRGKVTGPEEESDVESGTVWVVAGAPSSHRATVFYRQRWGCVEIRICGLLRSVPWFDL
jgi:hypothetical protein